MNNFLKSSLSINKKQKIKIKGRDIPSFYFALGAIRTRDLSLKRGVLYQLSYKRKSKIAIHFVCALILARTFFNVNSFFIIFFTISIKLKPVLNNGLFITSNEYIFLHNQTLYLQVQHWNICSFRWFQVPVSCVFPTLNKYHLCLNSKPVQSLLIL